MSPAIAVRERGILMSGPMVRAILDGRKTQTRRVIVPQPTGATTAAELSELLTCRLGQPGGRLWVREAFFDHGPFPGDQPTPLDARIEYREDEWDRAGGDAGGGWRPSIHMPRWASRLTLEITEVRVERLHDISAEDVKAEGCQYLSYRCAREMEPCDDQEFSDLWDMVNAKRGYPWETNWWVWVIAFKRATSEAAT